MQSEARLSRSMGLAAATAMVAGTMLGASIFVQPSVVSARVPTPEGTFLAWALAGALTTVGALVAAELSTAFPRSGGVYVFLREAYGAPLGFLWGWAMFWSMHTGIVAVIAMVCARYVSQLVPLSAAGLRLVAIAVIAALSAVNYLGVRHGSRVQTVFTAVKVAAVAVIVSVGFALGTATEREALGAAAPAVSVSALLLAISAGLFTFGGWHMVTYTAEETVDPARTLPRALVIGTLLVTVCYVALNAVYFHVLPMETVARSKSVAADAARAVVGPGAAAAVSGLVVVSAMGALNGIVLAGPRVYYAMARDGLLFSMFSRVHPAFRTPHTAIVLQAGWASVLVATGTYEQLLGRVVYTEWIFFALMALAVPLLRRRPGYSPAFRVPGGAPLAVAFAVASVAVAVNQMMAEPADSAWGMGLVLLGLPVFLTWRRRSVRQEG
jgi:APA family basic amino acid/polyamine antiporter